MAGRPIAVVQTLGVVASSALAAVLTKLSLGAVPPLTFVWLQIAIGGGLLCLFTFGVQHTPLPRGLDRRVWLGIAVTGVCNFAVVRICFMLALARLPATTQAYLVNFVGLLTMVLSVALLGERPSAWQLVGAVLALVGLRVFFDEIPAPEERVGLIYLGVGVLALAVTNTIARWLMRHPPAGLTTPVFSSLAVMIGGTPVVLWGLATDLPVLVPTVRDWAVIALSATVVIAIGLTVWNHVLRSLRSYEASLLGSSVVLWVALFAAPVLGERLRANQLAGIALLIVGLGLTQVRRSWSRPGA